MTIYPSFASRPGKTRPYPGIVQTKNDTCVFASIAGAVNHVTSTRICTEDSLLSSFLAAHERIPTFGSVAKYIPTSAVKTNEYHDRDNPLPSYDVILNAISSDAVVILSLAYANVSNGKCVRREEWHMLSVFRAADDTLQVWDTANRMCFFADDEFKRLITGNGDALEYGADFLAPHDAHNLLIVERL